LFKRAWILPTNLSSMWDEAEPFRKWILSTLLLHVSTTLCVDMSSRKLKEFVRLYWRVLPSLILSLILIRTFVNFLFQLLYDFIYVNFITCTCFENLHLLFFCWLAMLTHYESAFNLY
jgi:hypothetical protein